jgi:membrane-bound lytic murein transglycosylase D
MGYGGLLAAIRKYNTNDFWELSRLEAGMPLETALYVPKIIAIAVVARNRKVFGCDDIELDPAVTFDKVAVGSGVSLQSVASASGAGAAEIEALNPQLLARRTPPPPLGDKDQARWEVRVPPGAGPKAAKSIPRLLSTEPKLERYLVRWGESLDDIARLRGVSRSALQALNGLRPGEIPRPGTLLFVPAAAPAAPPSEDQGAQPLIVVPAQRFSYDDRRRVFYRVVPGDTLRDVAAVLGVATDGLCRWNAIDPGAALHEGMTLQAFVPKSRRLAGDGGSVLILEEADARVIEVGTDAFFAHFEGLKGRKRVEIVAREGDDWRTLARRYGLTAGMLERINHRSRTSPLRPGEAIVVYVPAERVMEEDRPKEPEIVVAAPGGGGGSAEAGAEDAPSAVQDPPDPPSAAAPTREGAALPGPVK